MLKESKLSTAVLFKDHLTTRLKILDELLQVFELEGLILGAGSQQYYDQDDQN